MFIDELIEGCELTLTARFGSKTASFSSKAVEITSPKDKKEISGFIERHEGGLFPYVVAEMFTFNGHPLSFDNNEISCDFIGILDSKPYEWHNVRVYRINLDNECYIKLGSDDTLNKANLKDLSSVGIGIVVPKFLFVEAGEDILVTFSDYMKMFKVKTPTHQPETKIEKDIARFKKQISLIEAMNGGGSAEKSEKVNQRIEFVIKAKIVRVVDTINRKTIGCKFLAINQELSKYVNEKQMEKRRAKNRPLQ